MKNKEGFITDEVQDKWILGTGVVLSVLTLFGYFFLAYEQCFERKYWINRFRLWRYLRKGKVTLLEKPRRLPSWLGNTIDELKIYIGGTSYEIWIYRDKNLVVLRNDQDQDLICLFLQSPILKRINRKTIERLDRLHVGKYK
jgi:hypothetical protein